MDDALKRKVLLVAVIIYVISPIDLIPGVMIDDIIIAILGYKSYQKVGNSSDTFDY